MSIFLQRSSCSSCLLRLSSYRSFYASYLHYSSVSSSSSHSTPFDTDSTLIKPGIQHKVVHSSKGKREQNRVKSKGEDVPRRNLLERTKVQEYLDYVASTNTLVVLADIERCRPQNHSEPGTPKYESEYSTLLENLVRSFSSKQLQRFLELYHLDPPVKRTKWNYAASIIERQWNWPSLIDIQKRQKDWSEVTYESFLLTPSQSFLILGKDGANLLSLSTKYNVHVSFSSNPLCLNVEGLRGSLENIGRFIAEFKGGIEQEEFTLSRENINPDVLQRISRQTGVYIEDMGSLTLRMSYLIKEHRAAYIAKRLVMHASLEEHLHPPLLVCSPGDSPGPKTRLKDLLPKTYSLYPFLSSRSLSRLEGEGGLFRLRRVGEWLKLPQADVQETHWLSEGSTILNANEETTDIKRVLVDQLPRPSQDTTGSTQTVTVSFGHVLMRASASQKSRITPPLKGQWELPKLFKWIQSNSATQQFTPSFPLSILDPSRIQQHLYHRIVYQAVSGPVTETDLPHHVKTFKVELDLGSLTPPSKTHNFAKSRDGEGGLFTSSNGSHHMDVHSGNSPIGGDATVKCTSELIKQVDVMIPDCALDVRFSAFDFSELLEEEWPPELQMYHGELGAFQSTTEQKTSQPDPPLTFVHQDTTYVLRSTSHIRQSIHLIPASVMDSKAGKPVRVIVENVLDPESNQKCTTCEVSCEDVSEGRWGDFLGNCDRLLDLATRSMSQTGTVDEISSNRL